MISKIEKNILSFLEENIIALFMVAAVLLNLYIRYSVRDLSNNDMDSMLLGWYMSIKNAGGLRAFSQSINTDYNIPYMELIAILTYFPIKAIYAFKISSGIFDYLLAGIIYKIVLDITGNKNKAIFAFCATIMSPLVLTNSAVWGQCDSVYTFFVICAIYYLYKEKFIHSFVFLGVAFGFKLQTIFVVPLFLFYYFYKKRFSILYFLIIPVVMELLCIPAIVQGVSLRSVFDMYLFQSGQYHLMQLNFPTFWLILNNETGLPSYDMFKDYAVMTTVFVLGSFIFLWLVKKVDINSKNILYMTAVCTLTCVEFLPSMHERYGFIAEILFLILVFFDIKFLRVLIPMYCVILTMCSNFLYGAAINHTQLSWIYFAVYVYAMYLVNKKILNAEESA
jgi:Gpi18-like mannosyltransferase